MGQFDGIAKTPLHKHNGKDSPRIPIINLGLLAGLVTLVAGVATIVDKRIGASSVILVTGRDNHAPVLQVYARCYQGYATITIGSSAEAVNYLIILNP